MKTPLFMGVAAAILITVEAIEHRALGTVPSS
jgi:hypothetical protein